MGVICAKDHSSLGKNEFLSRNAVPLLTEIYSLKYIN